MNKEIKIITLGDIFENIETEEKAFKFKDYIKDLQEKVEQLEKENEATLKNYGNLVKEWKQLENIRKEAIEYVRTHDYPSYFGFSEKDLSKSDLLNILNKGSDKE